jgi:hypothetical protein
MRFLGAIVEYGMTSLKINARGLFVKNGKYYMLVK